MLNADLNYLLMTAGICLVTSDILFDLDRRFEFLMLGLIVIIGSFIGITLSSLPVAVVSIFTVYMVYFLLLKKLLGPLLYRT